MIITEQYSDGKNFVLYDDAEGNGGSVTTFAFPAGDWGIAEVISAFQEWLRTQSDISDSYCAQPKEGGFPIVYFRKDALITFDLGDGERVFDREHPEPSFDGITGFWKSIFLEA